MVHPQYGRQPVESSDGLVDQGHGGTIRAWVHRGDVDEGHASMLEVRRHVTRSEDVLTTFAVRGIEHVPAVAIIGTTGVDVEQWPFIGWIVAHVEQ
jgi:hypothetical protein